MIEHTRWEMQDRDAKVSAVCTAGVRTFDAAVAEYWLIKYNVCSTPDNEAAFGEEEASAYKPLPRRT